MDVGRWKRRGAKEHPTLRLLETVLVSVVKVANAMTSNSFKKFR